MTAPRVPLKSKASDKWGETEKAKMPPNIPAVIMNESEVFFMVASCVKMEG